MNNAAIYREALSSQAPSAHWREDTLAAMRAAEACPRPTRSPWPRLAACAAALVLICAAGFFLRQHSAAPNLPTLTISPTGSDMSMGPYGDDMGLLIVQSYAEQTSKNPTLDNTNSIKELPVYKNTPPLERERLNPKLTAQGDTLEEQLARLYEQLAPLGGLTHPTLETTVDYDSTGTAHTWYAWFEDDPAKPLTDRLLDYCFARLGDEFHVDEFGDSFSYCKLPARPTGDGVLYPIRTAAQAEADFRAGEYLGADAPTDTQNAQILHIELTYLTESYQPYLQPVYKITYTQDYWDVSTVMSGTDDPAAYTSVSFAYVPAVAAEHVEITAAEFQFN